MSLAERMAEEIKQQREQERFSKQWNLKASIEAEKHAPALWDDLVETIKSEVKKFSELEPSAKSLRADSQSDTHLLIHTQSFPIIKVNIFKSLDGFVNVDMAQIPSGFSSVKQWKTQKFRFAVDDQLSPCLTDGNGRQHTATLLAERILESVFLFFADPKNSDPSRQFI